MQSLLGQMQTRQAELAAAQHLISYFSSPCFSLKIVDNFGWTRQEHMLEKYEWCGLESVIKAWQER